MGTRFNTVLTLSGLSTKLSQKNADDTDDTDLRRYDFFDKSNYKHFSIRENPRYPRHPRSKIPFKTGSCEETRHATSLQVPQLVTILVTTSLLQ